MPYFIIVKLFFALFGLSSERDVMLTPENPDNIVYFQVKRVRFGNILLLVLDQFVFILYLLVTTIILINLLIAMMSDTYQRIQVLFDKTTTFFNQKKNIIFLSATIRHGVEIWQIKIDNVSDILILYLYLISSS